MCTSIALNGEGFYFGRNLDLEYSFGERAVITPRRYPFVFRQGGRMERHFAMVGMAAVEEGYPLYAEAANEKGLCMAGLNFPGNAFYPEAEEGERANISPFELIPWILGQCASVKEARAVLRDTRLAAIPFSRSLPLTPLHWHIADRNESIVLEPMREGMRIYENPAGVTTNNPPFDFHMTNLHQYLNLTTDYPGNRFSDGIALEPFGVGLGSIGLPGDFSPASRLIKAAFLRFNSVQGTGEEESVSRFFHLLDAVAMPDGIVRTQDGRYEKTAYSCCMDAEKGIFYYKTYTNSRLTAVHMNRENLDGESLAVFELRRRQDVFWEN